MYPRHSRHPHLTTTTAPPPRHHRATTTVLRRRRLALLVCISCVAVPLQMSFEPLFCSSSWVVFSYLMDSAISPDLSPPPIAARPFNPLDW